MAIIAGSCQIAHGGAGARYALWRMALARILAVSRD
jgi:hypothetical protein